MRMLFSIACLDIWGEDVADNPMVWKQGDVDGRCAPTGRGLLPMDWLGTPSTLLPLWLVEDDGAPYLGDPRQALAAVVERYRAQGLTPVIAAELEFYLVDTSGDEPTPPRSQVTHKLLDGDGALCIDDLDHLEAFFTDVYAACDAHGIPVDSAISENGGGQFEINLLHVADPLKAADDALYGHGVVGNHLFGRILADAVDGDAARFDIFARMPWARFPGGRRFAVPYSVLGSWWYRLRDGLGV